MQCSAGIRKVRHPDWQCLFGLLWRFCNACASWSLPSWQPTRCRRSSVRSVSSHKSDIYSGSISCNRSPQRCAQSVTPRRLFFTAAGFKPLSKGRRMSHVEPCSYGVVTEVVPALQLKGKWFQTVRALEHLPRSSQLHMDVRRQSLPKAGGFGISG